MKLIQNVAIGAFLFTSMSLHAQISNDTTAKFIPPVIVKDQDKASKSESKKKGYKSKEWRQGNEVINDTTKGLGQKPKLRLQKKAGKQHGTPPAPPPPPALPSAPPPKPQ